MYNIQREYIIHIFHKEVGVSYTLYEALKKLTSEIDCEESESKPTSLVSDAVRYLTKSKYRHLCSKIMQAYMQEWEKVPLEFFQ